MHFLPAMWSVGVVECWNRAPITPLLQTSAASAGEGMANGKVHDRRWSGCFGSEFQVSSSESGPAQRHRDFAAQFPIRTAPAAG